MFTTHTKQTPSFAASSFSLDSTGVHSQKHLSKREGGARILPLHVNLPPAAQIGRDPPPLTYITTYRKLGSTR